MLKVKICGAENLKYIWRRSQFRPFATAYVDINKKVSTKVDEERDRCPSWDETLKIPLDGPIDDDTTLCVVIFDYRERGEEKRIGSASLKLKEVINDVKNGKPAKRTLKLKRIFGRSRGEVFVEVSIERPGASKIGKRVIRGLVIATALIYKMAYGLNVVRETLKDGPDILNLMAC
ncbi:hypothetical protein SLA2020_311420 [Shorea laevis]